MPKGYVAFRVWTRKQGPLNSQWLVLRIDGTDFPHCWVDNSIWLELSDSLITSFHGGLFRAFTNFIVVLCVNNSLVCHLWPASSWPHNSLS